MLKEVKRYDNIWKTENNILFFRYIPVITTSLASNPHSLNIALVAGYNYLSPPGKEYEKLYIAFRFPKKGAIMIRGGILGRQKAHHLN